jgi:hypothetical protein
MRDRSFPGADVLVVGKGREVRVVRRVVVAEHGSAVRGRELKPVHHPVRVIRACIDGQIELETMAGWIF